ncbi:hypothetical protein [Kluyvera ascorbata]|uniref:hypothetical protein n=1 Tax=Kluyvera ascorbata TaxID=51288 RepID=UPI0028DDB845|nr:hypothetical protein [Kluyvera ascorbata]MDT8699446.1 hypothetical protein [Kluyvera ascorbata]
MNINFNLKNICINKRLYFFLPFLFVVLFYSIFIVYVVSQINTEGVLGELGSFGDSFGIINAFFSGLGFAGLVVTLLMQQGQIARQDAEYLKQDVYLKNQEYTNTLFKLLDIYGGVLNEVVINYENEKLTGREALKKSLFIVITKIKNEKVNELPPSLRRKIRSKSITNEDIEDLNYIFYQNLKLLNYSFKPQGRLIATLHALLYHLHYNKPNSFDNNELIRLVSSQLTYIEYNYLFFILISDNSQKQLRDLVVELGLVKYMAKSHIHEVHKMMFQELWGIDINKEKNNVDLPMDKNIIKQLERNKEKIIKRLNIVKGK